MLRVVRFFQHLTRKPSKNPDSGRAAVPSAGRAPLSYDPKRYPDAGPVAPSQPAAPGRKGAAGLAPLRWVGRSAWIVLAALGTALLAVLGGVGFVLYHTGAILGRSLLDLVIGVISPFLRLAVLALVVLTLFGWWGMQPGLYLSGCGERFGRSFCPGHCRYLTLTGLRSLTPGSDVPNPCPVVILQDVGPHGPLTWF